MIPQQLQLGQPWALLLLLAPLVVRWLAPAHRTRKQALRAPFLDQLASALGQSPAAGAVVLRGRPWQRVLLPLVWLLVVAALARPQWVEDPITRVDSARDLMLAVDLSGSMDTKDFEGPDGSRLNRLQAVKLVLDDFVTRRQGDRLGLILFGSAAFTQVPFTLDHAVFRQLLDQVQIGMAGPHTMLGDAIGLAAKAFETSDAKQRVLILLTDGNDTGSRVPPAKAAEIASGLDITIHTIGVGDPEAAGEAPLDEELLRGISSTSGGQFFRANDREQLEAVYRRLEELEPLEYEAYSYSPRRELYAWPLGAMVILLVGYHTLGLLMSLARRRPRLARKRVTSGLELGP